MRCDKADCARLGVELAKSPVSAVRDGYVRHDPELLAAALLLAAWRLRALPAVVLLYVAVSCVRWLILRARGGRGISE